MPTRVAVPAAPRPRKLHGLLWTEPIRVKEELGDPSVFLRRPLHETVDALEEVVWALLIAEVLYARIADFYVSYSARNPNMENFWAAVPAEVKQLWTGIKRRRMRKTTVRGGGLIEETSNSAQGGPWKGAPDNAQ